MKYIRKLFDKHVDEYLEFEEIENPLHEDMQMCGMLYLKNLCEKDFNLTGSMGGIGITLDSNLKKTLTEEDVIYLHRCGITYSRNTFQFTQ